MNNSLLQANLKNIKKAEKFNDKGDKHFDNPWSESYPFSVYMYERDYFEDIHIENVWSENPEAILNEMVVNKQALTH